LRVAPSSEPDSVARAGSRLSGTTIAASLPCLQEPAPLPRCVSQSARYGVGIARQDRFGWQPHAHRGLLPVHPKGCEFRFGNPTHTRAVPWLRHCRLIRPIHCAELRDNGRVDHDNHGSYRHNNRVQTATFVIFAIAQAALAVVAIRLYRRRPSLSALMLVLPIAGVVWDNAIMALGATIGDGPLLVALSWPRFIGHALLTPTWIVAGIGFATRAKRLERGDGELIRPKLISTVGPWLLYGIAALAGFLRYVVFLEMAPVSAGGMFYYTNKGTFPGPPVGSILMLFVVLICAVLVWRRAHTPWLLLGTLFMLATQVIPRELVGFLVTNSGEVLMAASLVATEAILQRRELLANQPTTISEKLASNIITGKAADDLLPNLG